MLYTDPVITDRNAEHTKVHRVPGVDEGYAPEARAFHWGGLTTGNRWTAFWIFLAPFALANTAGYLIEKRGKRTVFFVRLAGLALTALFAAQAITAAAVLQRWIVAQPWSPGLQRWATTVLITLVGLFLLWIAGILSTQSHFAHIGWLCRLKLLFLPGERWLRPPSTDDQECQPSDDSDWTDPTASNGSGEWAADPRLWVPHSILHRLRRIHMATALAIVAIMVGRGAAPNAVLYGSGFAVVAAGVILLTATTTSPEERWVRVATSWLTPLAALAAVGSIVAISTASPFAEWVGIHNTNLAISLAFGVGALGTLIFGGGKAVGALAIAAFLGSSFGIAGATMLERVTSDPVNDQGLGIASDSVLNNGAGWVSVWMLVMVLVLVTVACALSLWPAEQEPKASLIPPDGQIITDKRRKALKESQKERNLVVAIRRITHRIRYLLWAAIGVGLAAAAGLARFCQDGQCSASNLKIDATDWGLVKWLAWIALVAVTIALANHKPWLAIAVPLATALVMFLPNRELLKLEILQVEVDFTRLVDTSLAVAVLIPALFFLRSVTAGIGDRESRRKTGLLWDVASFWPRHFHPLGPPAYGPIAVRELGDELKSKPELTLSAHSQGSMIATITLTQMNAAQAADLKQVVTYGSPLGLIYGDVFSPAGFEKILETKSGHPNLKWINLWRKSDYLGGLPIAIPGDTNHLADDIGHSHYECTRQYRDVIGGMPVTAPHNETLRCREPLPN